LKNHGTDKEVSEMFDMGAETMALPLEERMKFEQGDEGQSFGSVVDLAYKCLSPFKGSLSDTRKQGLMRSMQLVRT